MWLGPRLGRGDYFFSLILLNILYLAGVYGLSGRFSAAVSPALRTRLADVGGADWPLFALGLAIDLIILRQMVRRLHDANLSGWWLAALAILLVLPVTISSALGLLAFALLVFMPGTLGPNRFGPDPRGWKSQEHYDDQQRRIRDGNL